MYYNIINIILYALYISYNIITHKVIYIYIDII